MERKSRVIGVGKTQVGTGYLFWYLKSWWRIQKLIFTIGSISRLTDPTESKIWPANMIYCLTEIFYLHVAG